MDSVANVNDAASSGSNCEIEPRLYKAATKGNIEPFKEINQHDLHLMVTPIKNTILHIYMTSLNQTPKSTEFVKQILEICPSLLLQVNASEDTPLHVAARCGYSVIVEVLIECAKAQHEEIESGLGAAKQMLRMTNSEGNTALHEAVRSAYLDVVKILTKEDPEFSYSANHYGETPLFLAAATRSVKIVTEILETCKSVAHEGTDGRTALHAAVMTNDLDSVEKILEKNKFLTKETDQNGWTPLHYAAYYGKISIAKRLVESENSAAYTVDNDRKMTALHMAASQGYKDIMEAIISHCPDCCEMVDDKGWNFLHFAMTSLSVYELRSILTKLLVSKCLLREDVKGNTPVHVLAACRPAFYKHIMKEFGDYKWLLNKRNESVQDILSNGYEELQQEIKRLSEVVEVGPYRRGIIRGLDKWDEKSNTELEKVKESHTVVAALIATVTFAAAFTMPGGYKDESPNEGTAILTKNGFFQSFIISDAIAMILSAFIVFIHVVTSNDTSQYKYLLRYTSLFMGIAMGSMVVAFATGASVVLTPSFWLSKVLYSSSFIFNILVVFTLYKVRSFNLKAKP